MSFGTVLLSIPWSKKGKTQDFFDKFEAGLRTHNKHMLSSDLESLLLLAVADHDKREPRLVKMLTSQNLRNPEKFKVTQKQQERDFRLAHQNRTIAITSDFRVDGAKLPEIPQKEGVLGSEIAARNRRSLATFHRTLKSQCGIAFSGLGNRAISGVRDGHRNRKNRCDFGALSSGTRKNSKSLKSNTKGTFRVSPKVDLQVTPKTLCLTLK